MLHGEQSSDNRHNTSREEPLQISKNEIKTFSAYSLFVYAFDSQVYSSKDKKIPSFNYTVVCSSN